MSQRLYMRLDDGPLEPAEFRVVPDADGMGNERRIYVCCPKCGVVTKIEPEIHTVHRSGACTPIWPCSNPACSFSEWLVLTEEPT